MLKAFIIRTDEVVKLKAPNSDVNLVIFPSTMVYKCICAKTLALKTYVSRLKKNLFTRDFLQLTNGIFVQAM